MRVAALCLVFVSIGGMFGVCAADLPVVGFQPRSARTVAEGGRISWYVTNSKLSEGWDLEKVMKYGVTAKFKVSGSASAADFLQGTVYKNLFTYTGKSWRTLDVKKDGKVEGKETLTLELIPDPSYTIDLSRSKITFVLTD